MFFALNSSSGLLRSAQLLPEAVGGVVTVTIFGETHDFMNCLTNVLRASIADGHVTEPAPRVQSKVIASGEGDGVAFAARTAAKECNSDCFVITIVTGQHGLPGMQQVTRHTLHVTTHTVQMTARFNARCTVPICRGKHLAALATSSSAGEGA